jgi:hypothetical protein
MMRAEKRMSRSHSFYATAPGALPNHPCHSAAMRSIEPGMTSTKKPACAGLFRRVEQLPLCGRDKSNAADPAAFAMRLQGDLNILIEGGEHSHQFFYRNQSELATQ